MVCFFQNSFSQISCGGIISPCLETNSGTGFYIEMESSWPVWIDYFETITQNPGTMDVSIYSKPGTYTSFESDSSAWSLLGSVSGFTPLHGLSCPLPVTTIPIIVSTCFPANQRHSFYIIKTGGTGTFEYHKQIPEGDTLISDGTLTLFSGKATTDFFPFQGAFLKDSGSFQGNAIYHCGCNLSVVTTYKEQPELFAYPVPATEYVIFHVDKVSLNEAEILIYNPEGKLVLNGSSTLTSSDEKIRLDISGWAPGIYNFVLKKSNGQVARTLFLKQ